MTVNNDTLQIVGPKGQFPEVALIEPAMSGYLLLALEVDRRPPIGFFIESKRKKQLLQHLKRAAQQFASSDNVLNATIFKASIIPPGRGALLKRRPQVDVARFDVVMLIELASIEAAQNLRTTNLWRDTVLHANKTAQKATQIAASNTRRIGPVDHSRDGVFLFNYFYADSLDMNLQVWKYTAGWFQDQTGLDNSTVLLPQDDEKSPYTIINHCRWNRLHDILPALLFNKTFSSFVLANFEKNNTAAMPILYRLA